MKLLKTILFTLALFPLTGNDAQDVVKKASRESEEWFDGNVAGIRILGEKAVIKVSGWDQEKIRVKLTSVSRNYDEAKAVAELKYIKHEIRRIDNTLEIRNFFRGEYDKISGNLSIRIEVSCPKETALYLNNLYGPVTVSKLSEVYCNVAFGSAKLSDISRKTTAELKYSDIDLENIAGTLKVIAEKSDIEGKNIKAQTALDCNYGNVNLDCSGKAPPKIKAHRTGIVLHIAHYKYFNYYLTSSYGKIYFPGNPKAVKESLKHDNRTDSPLIDIKTTYRDIKITTDE